MFDGQSILIIRVVKNYMLLKQIGLRRSIETNFGSIAIFRSVGGTVNMKI